MQLQNGYAKYPENRSYLETLVEACDLTIYWEVNKKSRNINDRGIDGRSVNVYVNDRRGRGNNNRDRDNNNNNNNESNSDPSEILFHGEACYGG